MSSEPRRTSFATTDWERVVELYELLRMRRPRWSSTSTARWQLPMHAGASAGLDELDAIPEREVLARYPYALAAYPDDRASLGNVEEARAYLDRALDHQTSPTQHTLLARKRAALDAPPRGFPD
jgi:predicted RNA polymerase sigma factor